jgi:hypothetical protein
MAGIAARLRNLLVGREQVRLGGGPFERGNDPGGHSPFFAGTGSVDAANQRGQGRRDT